MVNKDMKRCHILVSGTVQGVFFRAFTRENAEALGLTGWVRNTLDNKVEVMIEGEEADIDEMIKKLRKGPPSAKVTDLVIEWQETKKEFSNFSILR